MSELSTLARPYARAVFELARDRDALANWHEAMVLCAAMAADDRVRDLLTNPAVSREQRQSIFVGASEQPEGFDNFIAVLSANDRLVLLPIIVEEFATLRADHERTLTVTVQSALPLSDSQRAQIAEAMSRRTGRSVELDETVDESLIGGVRILAGDEVIDGSLRGRLERLGSALNQ
ncbi:MAG: ATP synthase subunit delta [Lysobacteraceae bacterium]|nr:MAG: ATP synthase subunit delta [Xanthomonadaceae bacterium]